VSLRAIFGI
jgi:hypothetical protein